MSRFFKTQVLRLMERLSELLAGFLDQSRDAEQERRQREGWLKSELTEVEGAIHKLLAAVTAWPTEILAAIRPAADRCIAEWWGWGGSLCRPQFSSRPHQRLC
jgi:hypothetical protein